QQVLAGPGERGQAVVFDVVLTASLDVEGLDLGGHGAGVDVARVGVVAVVVTVDADAIARLAVLDQDLLLAPIALDPDVLRAVAVEVALRDAAPRSRAGRRPQEQRRRDPQQATPGSTSHWDDTFPPRRLGNRQLAHPENERSRCGRQGGPERSFLESDVRMAN